MVAETTLFVGAALLSLLLGLVIWNSTYWLRRGVRGPAGFPLWGNMWQFVRGKKHWGDVYEDIYNKYNNLPYIGFYRIFNEPAILLRSQEMIKEIMVRNFSHFQDNVLWVNVSRDPIINCNPFVAKGATWRPMRSELAPLFTPNKVKASMPHITAVCKRLINYVDENLEQNQFELKNLFSRFTLDVVASAGFGLDGQSFSNNKSDFTTLVEHLFLPSSFSIVNTIALLFSPTVGNLTNYRYMPTSVQQWLHSIINQIIQQRLKKSAAESANTANSDFVQWLIEAKQKQQEPVNADIIVGHCSTILLEGFETSSSLMAFALYEYATNPVVQTKVLQEIDEVIERFNGEVSHEALEQMSYFEASLLETLRLHPPMMALLKHCTKSFELLPQIAGTKAVQVPKGMVCVVPVKAIHYDADLYADPLKFQPERFLAANENKQRLFLGFGDGPRMCPGMRFGLAQSKAGLATLLLKYRVQLADKMRAPMEIDTTTFLTVAKDGVWISFKTRK